MTRRPSAPRAALLLALALPTPLACASTDTEELQAVLQKLAAQQAALDAQQQELDRQRQELLSLTTQVREKLGIDSVTLSALPAESSPSNPQDALPPEEHLFASREVEEHEEELGLEISGYGITNYYQRDWETDEFAKDSVDVERFILEVEYRFDENWFAKAELEYEHGGSGATLELDSQEEFGEFEQEIEAGGEVLVEELYVGWNYSPWLNAKFGHFVLPMGRTNKWHKPADYFTVARSEADASMIPLLWHETGVSIYGSWSLGDWGTVAWEGQVINGLDSTGFSSRNWVAPGHQKRFEQARAEELAMLARVDYFLGDDLQLGAAWYGGDTNNRPKNDFDYDAFVDIVGFDGQWTPGDFILRGQYLWGRLQNSHLVTEANRSLSNNLGVKRTAVGSEAQSWYLEAGYDLFGLFGPTDQKLVLFGRYDDYDSMYRTEGLVFDNPRWHRQSWTLGMNYTPIRNITFKAEYNQREVDLDSNNKEDTFALGVGFVY